MVPKQASPSAWTTAPAASGQTKEKWKENRGRSKNTLRKSFIEQFFFMPQNEPFKNHQASKIISKNITKISFSFQPEITSFRCRGRVVRERKVKRVALGLAGKRKFAKRFKFSYADNVKMM